MRTERLNPLKIVSVQAKNKTDEIILHFPHSLKLHLSFARCTFTSLSAPLNMASPPVPLSNKSHITECPDLYEIFWRKEHLTKVTYKNLVALASINSIAVVATIFLNALVIFAVATRHRLRTNTTILLACLAVSDLIAGLIVQPVGIAVDVKRIINEGPFCTLEKIYQAVVLGASFGSISHLVLISLERYIAIKQPLRYEDIVTKQRLTTGVILVWAITLVATIQEIVLASIDSNTNIYSVYLNVTAILLAIIVVICIAAIGYTNGYIFSETQRQQKRIKTEQISSEEAKRIKKDHRAAITLVLLLSALIFTYVPGIIFFLMAASANSVKPRIINILWRWAFSSVLLGSLLNPIIYSWRTKKLRHAFLEILHLRQPENSPPPIEMEVRQRHRPESQPITSETFSRPMERQERVLLSFHHMRAEEIISIEEND